MRFDFRRLNIDYASFLHHTSFDFLLPVVCSWPVEKETSANTLACSTSLLFSGTSFTLTHLIYCLMKVDILSNGIVKKFVRCISMSFISQLLHHISLLLYLLTNIKTVTCKPETLNTIHNKETDILNIVIGGRHAYKHKQLGFLTSSISLSLLPVLMIFTMWIMDIFFSSLLSFLTCRRT
jgi:hypothetical protein